MAHADAQAPPAVRTAARIAALDWARGWMLVASVTVNSVFIPVAALQHAAWTGVTPLDIIFPLFVTLSGVGMAFAFARRVDIVRVIRRALVLLALGLVYNAVQEWSIDPETWRFTGVLQLYAVLIMIVAGLHMLVRSWRGWAVIAAATALAHSIMISVVASQCVAGLVVPQCNPSGVIDPVVFGAAHIYQGGAAGHDPEGIVAILGALVSASIGAMAGHLILEHRDGSRRGPWKLPSTTVPLMVMVLVLVVAAVSLPHLFDLLGGSPVPVMKRLWTAPFAAAVGALALGLVWLGQAVLQRTDPAASAKAARVWDPVIGLGRNSLLVYFGSHAAMAIMTTSIIGPSVVDRVISVIGNAAIAQALWTVVWLALWWALAYVLHRRGIYVRP